MKTSKKRSSWLYLVIVLSVLAFVGFSLLPLLSGILKNNQVAISPKSASASVQQLSPEQQQELETKAKGYELVLQREPENATALQGLVEVRLQQGYLTAALEPLETLAKLKAQQPDYTILLAEGKRQVGDYEGAFAAYETVLKDNPGNIKALQGMVNLQIQQDRPEGAIGRLQDTLKLATQANLANPGSIDVTSIQLLLGQVYVRQDRFTEAIAVYDQAIESNPQDFRPLFAKALILKEQGQYTTAKSLFTSAVSLAPPKYKDQIQQEIEELSLEPENSAEVETEPIEEEPETNPDEDN
ncbi:tetratricopeptide repeat protein [Lusitaniella coriacea]|uniref:tetratricopeptide repeat protein n=1 Tax=Lusitaniella coriacea TaxID=1983105 RepID=UPI002D218B21|nr:tetratricopeptide repeat protein [Lusitaniella coriacea]